MLTTIVHWRELQYIDNCCFVWKFLWTIKVIHPHKDHCYVCVYILHPDLSARITLHQLSLSSSKYKKPQDVCFYCSGATTNSSPQGLPAVQLHRKAIARFSCPVSVGSAASVPLWHRNTKYMLKTHTLNRTTRWFPHWTWVNGSVQDRGCQKHSNP